jgi:hypothetical protein
MMFSSNSYPFFLFWKRNRMKRQVLEENIMLAWRTYESDKVWRLWEEYVVRYVREERETAHFRLLFGVRSGGKDQSFIKHQLSDLAAVGWRCPAPPFDPMKRQSRRMAQNAKKIPSATATGAWNVRMRFAAFLTNQCAPSVWDLLSVRTLEKCRRPTAWGCCQSATSCIDGQCAIAGEPLLGDCVEINVSAYFSVRYCGDRDGDLSETEPSICTSTPITT